MKRLHSNDWDTPVSRFRKLAIAGDAWLATACLLIAPSRSGLLIFAFHGLFESAEEIARNTADPQQAMTTSMFRGLVENLVNSGYRFVSPAGIVAGLDPAGKYAMISFDDGYANNRRALAAMEEFHVPALFSISANHVRTGKPFWWDVLYREARKLGWEKARLDGVRASLKHLRTCEIEQRLIAEFGQAAFQTVSDTDRPFTPDELAEFARHPLVEIGNHTCDHAILTNYPILDVASEIGQAQDWLQEVAGKAPQVIAYPNGNVSPAILGAVQDAGIPLGLIGQPGRNSIARASAGLNALLLKRHTLWGFGGIELQCRIARSSFSVQAAAAAIRSKVTGQVKPR